MQTSFSRERRGTSGRVDPWSHPAEEYRACYREIVASVDGLADALKD